MAVASGAEIPSGEAQKKYTPEGRESVAALLRYVEKRLDGMRKYTEPRVRVHGREEEERDKLAIARAKFVERREMRRVATGASVTMTSLPLAK